MSDELADKRIGFIGCGAMARALAGGLLAAGVPLEHMRASDLSDEQRSDYEVADDRHLTSDARKGAIASPATRLPWALKCVSRK